LCVIWEMASENDLRRAEELVAEGRRIVQQQKGRIFGLRAAGVDTWDAERVLHLLGANLRRRSLVAGYVSFEYIDRK
jgi:hypothetical protein